MRCGRSAAASIFFTGQSACVLVGHGAGGQRCRVKVCDRDQAAVNQANGTDSVT
jgi:hypothetical protein